MTGGQSSLSCLKSFGRKSYRGLRSKWICRLLGARGYLLASSQGRWVRSERLPGVGKTSVYRVTADLLGAAPLAQSREEEEEES